jgi:hypothetical protein
MVLACRAAAAAASPSSICEGHRNAPAAEAEEKATPADATAVASHHRDPDAVLTSSQPVNTGLR